jgi:methyltransferase (TIGR00027 family)
LTPFQNPLAYTALFVAAARAAESERPDQLFEDRFASLLAGDVGRQIFHAAKDRGIRTDLTADYIAIRTRFIDDALWQSFATGIRQIVIVAAGLDARAFRLHWPEGTTCFEIDTSEVMEFKENVLATAAAASKCNRIVVPIDLRNDWPAALCSAGFDDRKPTIWLVEGLLQYLAESEVRSLLTAVSALATNESVLIADLPSGSFLRSPYTKHLLDKAAAGGVSISFGADEPESFFSEFGWLTECHQLGEPGANFGRLKGSVYPRHSTEVPRYWLIRSTRRGEKVS